MVKKWGQKVSLMYSREGMKDWQGQFNNYFHDFYVSQYQIRGVFSFFSAFIVKEKV